MILASLQVVFLLAGGLKLASFKKGSARYRPIISILSACWAGACFALAASIILYWPNAVSQATALTATLTGISCGLIFWSHGNVAELGRKIMALRP